MVLLFMIKKDIKIKNLLLIGFAFICFVFLLTELSETTKSLPAILSLAKKGLDFTIVTGRLFYGVFYISAGIFLSYLEKDYSNLFDLLIIIIGFIINYLFDGFDW